MAITENALESSFSEEKIMHQIKCNSRTPVIHLSVQMFSVPTVCQEQPLLAQVLRPTSVSRGGDLPSAALTSTGSGQVGLLRIPMYNVTRSQSAKGV